MEGQRAGHPSRAPRDMEPDAREAGCARLIALGAVEIGRPRDGRWIVMQAPTGQRFCIVRAAPDSLARGATIWRETQ